MNRVAYVKPDFPVDAFAGTAPYYVRYRVPYPAELLQDLVARASLTGKGRLLDLACGPGRVVVAVWRVCRSCLVIVYFLMIVYMCLSCYVSTFFFFFFF